MTSQKEVTAFGGTEDCERVMVRFGDPAVIGYEETFPIRVLRIVPVSRKFAEKLTHRDFLGALMNLGLERDIFGDIIVREEAAYVFCAERMAAYICEELRQVRHTAVRCDMPAVCPEDARPALKEEQIIAASERLDMLIAKVWHLSRTKAKELFAAGAVQVGGRLCEKESAVPQTGDRISVRGFGKFRYLGRTGVTKKGSLVLKIEKYV